MGALTFTGALTKHLLGLYPNGGSNIYWGSNQMTTEVILGHCDDDDDGDWVSVVYHA